ncbi:MAG: GbsR/MarR family transcriptional regulator [Puniceicoccales bacterium]
MVLYPRLVSEIDSSAASLSLSNDLDAEGASAVHEWEQSMIEVFVRAAQLIGVPRSVGQIYGLLFCREDPLPMDDIMAALGISKGSASMGLKTLRQIGAVKTSFIIGDRRDHFTAELKLRKLVSGFISEQVQPHLNGGVDRLDHMETMLGELDDDEHAVAERRLAILRTWHNKMSKLAPILRKML